jgi:hypothetical protein
MKTVLHSIALALAAGALLGPTHALAKGSFLKVDMTIDFVFDATGPAPAGATGDATIEVKYDSTKKGSRKQRAKLELDVYGLPAGLYSAEAKLGDGSVVPLGRFNSEAGNDERYDFARNLPASIDARNVVHIIIKNAAGVAVLEGEGDPTIVRQKFSARARVTLANGSRAGSVRLFSETEDEDETDREIDFSASGAPLSQTLNIIADGETAGVVESDAAGNVEFTEDDFDEDIDLANVGLLTITDAGGLVLMQAAPPKL